MRGALAGIGAATVLYAFLNAVGLELWFQRVYVVLSGPTRFEILLLPAFIAGGFVAFRIARWRGSLLLTAFAAVGIVRALVAGSILPNIELARRGLPGQPADFDFVTPQAWALLGIALGTTCALMWRPTIPLRGALEAAGIYGIGMSLWALVQSGWLQLVCGSPDPTCLGLENVSSIAWAIVVGTYGGALFARRASAAGLLALSLIALPAIDVLAHQGGDIWRYGGPTSLLATAANLIGVIAALVAATFPYSKWPRSPQVPTPDSASASHLH